ncbi:MAG: cytochrome c peroxidase [Crocinitomicaceae bacterium]|nr:cytochrome c peroxidase [Crocinitomicaceae bacterium]MDG1657269.1 cytochrome c peroxidase [Crocinitomicaceae bacterium]MDG2441346.1 cytochrome c peroxidase [Crocinitomicaceae bacterium]
MKYLFVSFLLIVVMLSCKKDKVTYEATPYELEIPSHFPQMIIPEDNPMTVEGVELGRKLFYETMLSGDNSISCAECHAPSSAYSDPNQFSTGIDGIQGGRNSMALINLGWNQAFFWDGRAKTLEEQILVPVEDPIEMHETWTNAVSELSASIEYRNMFFKAFGDGGIDSTRVAKAIAQFLRTMISGSSKYDVMYKFENGLSLNSTEQGIYTTVTPSEWAGYDLFKSLNGADCFHCHNGPLMQVHKFSNNGLDATFSDLGRGGVTGNPNDNGKFKVPTLRNIAYSAPYMHDGRLATLDDVINHYSNFIQMSPTIDPLIEFAGQGGVQLDALEKDLLKQFLMTLSDENFVNNPDFQEPE